MVQNLRTSQSGQIRQDFLTFVLHISMMVKQESVSTNRLQWVSPTSSSLVTWLRTRCTPVQLVRTHLSLSSLLEVRHSLVDSDSERWRFGLLRHSVQAMFFRRFLPSSLTMLSDVARLTRPSLRVNLCLLPVSLSRSTCSCTNSRVLDSASNSINF